MTHKFTKLISDFSNILGKQNLITDAQELAAYSFDAKFEGVIPMMVLRPCSTKEVSRVLKICNREEIPVVPRGAGTGTTGGAVPIKKGIVIELVRLNRILEISHEELLARVQAGVVTADLDMEGEKAGLMYGPDPASSKTSTIGGNAATCAGGLRAVKYGVTKHHILELVVVLSNGDIIRTGSRAKKDVTGYDLTELFIGSEGTLGIITEITVRLLPRPEKKITFVCLFEKLEEAGQCVIEILRSGITPLALELMDKRTLLAVNKAEPEALVTPENTLLVEIAGNRRVIEVEYESLRDICAGSGATVINRARDEQEAKKLWESRRSISPALYELKSGKISEDVAVPVPRLADLIKGFRKIAESYELLWAAYGHGGDGNLHANILVDKRDKNELEKGEKARRELFELVVSMKGAISGEHGIGALKRDFIGMELSEENLNAQRAIKKALDPKNILNPEKVLPDQK